MFEVIHEWEDGTKFGLGEDGSYKLLYKGVLENITVIRSGLFNMAVCDNKDVPRHLLAEIGQNL